MHLFPSNYKAILAREPHPIRRASVTRTHSSLYPAEQKDTGTSYEAQGFLCGEEMNAWFNKQKLAAVSTGEEAAGSGFL